MADKKIERIEDIEGVIPIKKPKTAPKPSEPELRERLVNEMRDRQRNRAGEPKNGF